MQWASSGKAASNSTEVIWSKALVRKATALPLVGRIWPYLEPSVRYREPLSFNPSRFATRYDKLARNFLAATTLVGALYWIKLWVQTLADPDAAMSAVRKYANISDERMQILVETSVPQLRAMRVPDGKVRYIESVSKRHLAFNDCDFKEYLLRVISGQTVAG
jgi:hypothetical protein